MVEDYILEDSYEEYDWMWHELKIYRREAARCNIEEPPQASYIDIQAIDSELIYGKKEPPSPGDWWQLPNPDSDCENSVLPRQPPTPTDSWWQLAEPRFEFVDSVLPDGLSSTKHRDIYFDGPKNT